MHLRDRVVVVTGGGHGIGRALCRRFASEGARAVVVADLDEAAATAVADEIDAVAVPCDVSNEADLARLVARVEQRVGPIDLFCSNAGILGPPGGLEASNEAWRQVLDINFFAHLYAARAVVPGMLERGGGYLLQTCSAAGLLTQIGAAPYAVSKHAAVALAEWLAMTYGGQGLRVSCLCPQGVRTRMLDTGAAGPAGDLGRLLAATALEPEQVAQCVIAGLAEERFLILPHPEVAEYFQRKAADYDRWLGGMRRLQKTIADLASPG